MLQSTQKAIPICGLECNEKYY